MRIKAQRRKALGFCIGKRAGKRKRSGYRRGSARGRQPASRGIECPVRLIVSPVILSAGEGSVPSLFCMEPENGEDGFFGFASERQKGGGMGFFRRMGSLFLRVMIY